MFSSEVTSDVGVVEAIGASDGDVFAASLRRVGAAQTVFLGRLDDDASQTQVELAWQFNPEDVSHITWDGEAFAIHAMLNFTGELFVARVSLDGQLILPSAQYGVTPSSGLEYRLSTDPATGTTYLFDAARSSLVSGHDRSGQALPWAPGKPFNIVIPGINEGDGSAFNPGLAIDTDGGAWVAWRQGYIPNMVSVAAHITINGQIDRSVVFVRQPADRIPAVSATASSKVWIAQKMNQLINMFEINESNTVLPRVLLEDPYDKGEVFATYMDTRAMSGFDWKDERWLSFSEERTNVPVVFHVLRVDGNCTYSPATRPARM